MNGFEDFKRYLPQYLSPESQKELYEGLQQFPEGFEDRMFSSRLMDEVDVFQGDGLRDMPVSNLPETAVVDGPVLILSNTCDTSSSNRRVAAPSIIYCPIVKLSKLEKEYLDGGMPRKAVSDMLASIRAQKTTRFFTFQSLGAYQTNASAFLIMLLALLWLCSRTRTFPTADFSA